MSYLTYNNILVCECAFSVLVLGFSLSFNILALIFTIFTQLCMPLYSHNDRKRDLLSVWQISCNSSPFCDLSFSLCQCCRNKYECWCSGNACRPYFFPFFLSFFLLLPKVDFSHAKTSTLHTFLVNFTNGLCKQSCQTKLKRYAERFDLFL